MLVKDKPELASCITGCLQVAEDVCVVLFNTDNIKSNEKSKPERFEIMDNFNKLRLRVVRGLNKTQAQSFDDINAEISDMLIADLKTLFNLYQTELATKVKYDFIKPISYYIIANEFILLSQLYYIKLFGRENRFVNELHENMIKFANRVRDVNLNPERKIEIKNERIEQMYFTIIEKIITQSLKK